MITINDPQNKVVVNEETCEVVINSIGAQGASSGVNSITSADSSINITNPETGVVDLSVNASTLSPVSRAKARRIALIFG